MTWPAQATRLHIVPVLVALLGLVAGPLLVPAPASAQTWSKRDNNAKDDELAADYNIRKVIWNYTDTKLVIRSKFREVRKDDFSVAAVAQHADEGYQIIAYTERSNGRKETSLSIDYGGSSTEINCSGLRAVWKFGPDGSVRIVIPNSCTFDGWSLDRFAVWSAPPGAPFAFDTVESPSRRTSD